MKRLFAAAVLVVFLAPFMARAEVFMYKDERGRWHGVGSLSQVPEKFRDQCKSVSGKDCGTVPGKGVDKPAAKPAPPPPPKPAPPPAPLDKANARRLIKMEKKEQRAKAKAEKMDKQNINPRDGSSSR